MNIKFETPVKLNEEELNQMSKEELIELYNLQYDSIENINKYCSSFAEISLKLSNLVKDVLDELDKKINFCTSENAESKDVCRIQLKFHLRLQKLIKDRLDKIDVLSNSYKDIVKENKDE